MRAKSDEAKDERLRDEIQRLRGLLVVQEQAHLVLSETQERVTAQTRAIASAREDLEQQARLFHTVLSSIVDFVYVFDREGRFTYVNQALLDLWQIPLEDALGKNFFDLHYPQGLAARLQRQIQTVFATGEPLHAETPYTGAAGTARYYEYVFVPVFDKAGHVKEVAGSTRDITRRYQERAEKETLLKQSQSERARLISLFMQSPAFIAVLHGPTHIFEMTNPLYNQLVGGRNILGKTVREVLPEIEEQGFLTILDEVYRTGKPFIGSNVRILLQRESMAPLQERWVDFVYQPLREADGAVSGIFVHGVDLTEHRLAQREIETLNVRLRRSVQETHHRVKNNLQVIGALVELQMDGETVPVAALARIGQHTRALAAIHCLLTQEAKTHIEAEHISARAMMDELMPLLQATVGAHEVRYEAENFRLPVRDGASLALLVSELVTNAVKHGRKAVEVTLSMAENNARLEVCDDGPGFVAGFDWRKAANTGLELVDSISRHDLRGTVVYENRPGGGAKVIVVFALRPS